MKLKYERPAQNLLPWLFLTESWRRNGLEILKINFGHINIIVILIVFKCIKIFDFLTVCRLSHLNWSIYSFNPSLLYKIVFFVKDNVSIFCQSSRPPWASKDLKSICFAVSSVFWQEKRKLIAIIKMTLKKSLINDFNFYEIQQLSYLYIYNTLD